MYYAAGALRVRSDIEVESIGYHSDRFGELLYVGVAVSQTFKHHLSYSATRRADHENNGRVVKQTGYGSERGSEEALATSPELGTGNAGRWWGSQRRG